MYIPKISMHIIFVCTIYRSVVSISTVHHAGERRTVYIGATHVRTWRRVGRVLEVTGHRPCLTCLFTATWSETDARQWDERNDGMQPRNCAVACRLRVRTIRLTSPYRKNFLPYRQQNWDVQQDWHPHTAPIVPWLPSMCARYIENLEIRWFPTWHRWQTGSINCPCDVMYSTIVCIPGWVAPAPVTKSE